jgi:hypothetical protein
VALGVVAFHDGRVETVALVAFARTAPAALLTPVGTAFADRFSRDRVLVWTCLIRASATGGAAAVLALGGPKVPIYGLAVISTVAFRLFRPAHSALLPGLCNTPFELSSANVVRGLLDSVSTLLGQLAAALLLELSGFRIRDQRPLIARIGPTALPALIRSCAARAAAAAAADSARGCRRLPGPRTLSRRRSLDRTRACAVADRGLSVGLVVVLALEQLGMGAPGVGLLVAALGAGAVASSLGASAFVTGRRLAALEGIGVILWGLPLTLSGVLPYEPVVLGLMCMIGVGNALVDIGLHTLPARLVPDELLARVFGVKASLTALSIAIGSFITPLAIDLLGIRGALALLGLVAPVVAALAWRRLQTIDAKIAHRDEEIAVLNRIVMFRPLPMPAIDELASHVDKVEVAAGQEVFRQGDHGDRFYVIEDGEAEVFGDGRLIRTLRSGEGFGEIALLQTCCARPRSAPARPFGSSRSTGATSFPQSRTTSRASARRTPWCSTG